MATKWKIYNEDAVEWARNYQKGKFHALLCDPPYHLTSIVKRFGKKGSAPAKHGTDGVFSRSSKGFMGQQWDGGDIAFRPETWEAFGDVLYPGAFGMAFSASRNWHRLAVAIEDAGFIIHPTIFLWAQGQGFPKATRVKGQDTFDGHRYGLQALKPAVEPIIVFQKPYEGRPLDNIVETGAGALNIEASRIGTEDTRAPAYRMTSKGIKGGGYATGEMDYSRDGSVAGSASGRWPSNLILDGTAEALDKQTGILKSGKMLPTSKRSTDSSPNGIYGKFDINAPLQETIGDSGGASRFFYNVSQQLDENDPVYYCGKVSPKERNAGLDDSFEEVERRTMGTGMVGMSGDRSGKGNSTPIEMGVTKTRNPHPTLKPIDLTRYLATLLLPPAEYGPRRLFVPFSGVGSEMCGAGLAGWEQIVGVEFDTENGYVDIAKKRLEYWLNENK